MIYTYRVNAPNATHLVWLKMAGEYVICGCITDDDYPDENGFARREYRRTHLTHPFLCAYAAARQVKLEKKEKL